VSENGLNVEGIDNENLIEIIEGNKYWVLIFCPELLAENPLMNKVEMTYYTEDENEDFLMVFMQPGVLYSPFSGICLADKRHMSKKELKQLLKNCDLDEEESFITENEVLGKPVIKNKLKSKNLRMENRFKENKKIYFKWKDKERK